MEAAAGAISPMKPPTISIAMAAYDGGDRQVRAEKARLHISTLARHRRPGPIWRLWKSGDYDMFTGWKSVVKDLLR